MDNAIWKFETGWIAGYTEDKSLMARIKRYKTDKWSLMATYSQPHSKDVDRSVIFARQYKIPADQIRSAQRMFKVTEVTAETHDISASTPEKDVSSTLTRKKAHIGESRVKSVNCTKYFAIPDDRQLVETHCASYAGNGRCIFDRACPYFATTVRQRCTYYEDSVLSNDQSAEVSYWQERGWPAGKGALLTNCKSCDKPFLAVNESNHCAICSERIERERREAEVKR